MLAFAPSMRNPGWPSSDSSYKDILSNGTSARSNTVLAKEGELVAYSGLVGQNYFLIL